MNFSIISAIDNNNGIGINGSLPWYIPNDMKYFNIVTTGDMKNTNVVIMGRLTWESIPPKYRPLKNRINVVISSSVDKIDGADYVFQSLNLALNSLCKMNNINEVFVIGGEKLYNEAIAHELCNKLYITKIYENYKCDRFFPPIDPNIWTVKSCIKNINNPNYDFIVYS